MDFLDGIGSTRKSRRVRSWYLYEQYKALERNQLEAARQLNYKTSQDRLLYQELSEHRQRRKMCSESHSEPGIDYIRNGGTRSCVTMSINDIYESLCDLHEGDFYDTGETSIQESCLWSETICDSYKAMDQCSEQKEYLCGSEDMSFPQLNLNDPDDMSLPQSNLNDPDDMSMPQLNLNDPDDMSFPQLNLNDSDDMCLPQLNINDPDDSSLPQLNLNDPDFLLAASSGNLADEVKEELEFVKRCIGENIHLQLEMKANVQSLEDYAKPPEFLYEDKLVNFDDKASFEDEASKYAADVEEICDEESLCSFRLRSRPDKMDSNCSVYALWTKLVSFAYQLVQLKHGNCFYDYSSQFMTAVLACDILRRGIGRMCNVLQPYVSPIKCVSCMSIEPNSNNTTIKKERSNVKTTLSEIAKKSKGCSELKSQDMHIRQDCLDKLNLKSTSTHGQEITKSRNTWRQCSSDKCRTKTPLESEAWHSTSSHRSISLPSSKYSSTAWHEQSSNSSEFISSRSRVSNPMLKLAKYIDSIVQHVDRDDL